jgi:hypothetical protein
VVASFLLRTCVITGEPEQNELRNKIKTEPFQAWKADAKASDDAERKLRQEVAARALILFLNSFCSGFRILLHVRGKKEATTFWVYCAAQQIMR